MAKTVILRGVDLMIAPKWISLATPALGVSVGLEAPHHAGWWMAVDREMAACVYELQLGRVKFTVSRRLSASSSPAGRLAAEQA